jgi:hypothetical protein
MLPIAQHSAASSTSRKPMNVTVAPEARREAASSARPAAAITAPITLWRRRRSPAKATASPMVMNTWVWITIDDNPADMPSFMPRKSSPNWPTPMASP